MTLIIRICDTYNAFEDLHRCLAPFGLKQADHRLVPKRE